MKKVLTTALLFVVAAIMFGGGSVFADEFHKGEKPLKTYISEETGVITEVYAANPEEAEKVKKEQGWSEHKVEKVKKFKFKDGIKEQSETEAKVSAVLGDLTFAFIQNFGTIKASAHTDTAAFDLVGQEQWLVNGDWSKIQHDTEWHSHGGDYMFRLPAHSARSVFSNSPSHGTTPHGYVQLWEMDVTGGDYVTAWNFFPSQYELDYVVRGIDSFRDGIPSQAEFKTQHNANYTTGTTTIDASIGSVRYYD